MSIQHKQTLFSLQMLWKDDRKLQRKEDNIQGNIIYGLQYFLNLKGEIVTKEKIQGA